MRPTVRIAVAALVVVVAAPAAAQQQPTQQPTQQAAAPKAIDPATLTFAQNPNLLPGGQVAWLEGSPTQPGLYTFRVKFPANYRVMPHTHPDDRVYTVISGTWYIGLGTRFDAATAKGYPPGSVYFLPANTPHFHISPGAAEAQVTGAGPTATVYVNPGDDPRKK